MRWFQSWLAKKRQDPSTLNIVALITDEQDRALLADVSARNQWQVHFTDSSTEAWRILNQLKAPVVLCDRDLPANDWRHAVRVLGSSPHRGCAILLSRVVDDYLWNEVTASGGYDVLCKPLREPDVVRAVKLAWSYWNTANNRHDIRPFRTA